MAIQTITYSDKTALNSNSGVADANKVNATDMNEIKSVVNNNASETSTNTTKITNATTYSTNEVAIGTWIDSSIIYRKVISMTGTGTQTKAHGITNLKRVINIYGLQGNESGYSYPNNNTIYPYTINKIDPTNVTVDMGSAYTAGWTLYIVLEYIKS